MKNIRVKFQLNQQKSFLKDVYTSSGLTTQQLAKMVDVHPRSLLDWKKEKLTLSLRAAEIFCEKFNLHLPEEKEVLILRWKTAQQKANAIGGIAAYKKYGCQATKEGRSKGGKKALALLREKGIIPFCKSYTLPSGYSSKLAEYIGIMLGDGGLTPGQICITLNGEADREYILFVCQIGKELFGESPRIHKHKNDKGVSLYYNGVSLVHYLTTLGLKIGSKVKQQVGVPDWISSMQEYKIACLRGLMDTDGGVFLHKYKGNNKEYVYKKICFTNRSKPLLMFVSQTLEGLGFTPKIIDKIENKKVWLYNEQEVNRYLQIVGTHNARLCKHNQIL